MRLLYKKTTPDAMEPTRSYDDDFAFDLVATAINQEADMLECEFGLAFEIRRNWFEKIVDKMLGRVPCIKCYSRSSIKKYDLILSNCTGIVDNGYRNGIKAYFRILKSDNPRIYKQGDRVLQISIEYSYLQKTKEVHRLTQGTRGNNGFGSSGR